MQYPTIIQGGMGVAVSSWALAHAVSKRGQLGVVSGTGIDAVLVRRLQLGDVGGHIREALDHFPVPDVAKRVWQQYFVPGGIAPGTKFKARPIPKLPFPQALADLAVVANFVEVFLAKRGHSGVVGINLLEKIQIMTLPSLLGAMMAGVDFVLMGAGIPRQIPGILDAFAAGGEATMRMDVEGALSGEETLARLDAAIYQVESLKRPKFLAVVSSGTLAISLARKSNGVVDGFVVEHHTAGGHNAPPRGGVKVDEKGEPIYGERDTVDWSQFRELGLPFWLAGSAGTAEMLKEALALGAQGIQVGTAFAFCNESGIDPEMKSRVLKKALANEARVFTDPQASPTGFPFKVVGMSNTASEVEVYESRTRICDLGYLRQLYRQPDGQIGYRCAAEPVEDFVAKGGTAEGAAGRKCLCNGLLATVGMGQVRKWGAEPPIVTAGDDLVNLRRYVPEGQDSYSADDVIDYLLELTLPLRRSVQPA